MEVILFTIIAAAYDTLKEQAIAIFIILFALIQFFFQFGANATTFIIPAEVFPTRWLLPESNGKDLDHFEDF
jgi:PHS family inorganic phosphate transporter-like MFS transporter